MALGARNRARAAKWPSFLAWLDAGEAGPPRVERSPHGEAGVLVVDGVHLAGPLDPAREADALVARVLREARTVWAFGFAEGRAIAALLAERPDVEVRVVGLARGASRATFEHVELPWLDDPRVTLLAPSEVEPRAFASSAGARLLASAELRLAEPSALRDAIVFELASAHQARWLEERRAARTTRADANALRFASDGDVASLFGSRPGAHVVVAGGGPSLVPVVTSVPRDQVVLVAVSTALAPFERLGIVPDVAVMVDPHPALIGHVRALRAPERLRDVPLVYAADLDVDVLEAWPGPRLAAHLELPGYAEAARPRGALFCSGTVVHSAVDLAVKMGASVVRFAGLDFAYPGGVTHAEGAAFGGRRDPARAAGRVTVESVRGGLVPTDVNLLGYLRDLERYVAAHPEVRFVNGSAGGARIAGTDHEPVAAAEASR